MAKGLLFSASKLQTAPWALSARFFDASRRQLITRRVLDWDRPNVGRQLQQDGQGLDCVPQDVSLFANGVFADTVKLRRGHTGAGWAPNPVRLVSS